MKRDDSNSAVPRKRRTRSQSSEAVDFTRAIQPHRYAKLRPGYKYAVFLEPELWNHFGSPEAVKAALRSLVTASRYVRATG